MQVSQPQAVALAAGITAFITLGLTLFALQTKYDFTTANGVLTGALLAFILVGFARIFFPHMKLLEIAIGGGGAFLFSCFLVVDIQMLMDGALSSFHDTLAPLQHCLKHVHVSISRSHAILHG